MNQTNYSTIIKEQTTRALWEICNVIDCVPNGLWEKKYCEMPLWKHIYHMLHSLDKWFINPRDSYFVEPFIHEKSLNNLDYPSEKRLARSDIEPYFFAIKAKITDYLAALKDEELLTYPKDCEYTKFTLLLAQFRHLHTHMGMIMGFIIRDTGKWPRVLGLEHAIPNGDYDKFF